MSGLGLVPAEEEAAPESCSGGRLGMVYALGLVFLGSGPGIVVLVEVAIGVRSNRGV